MEMNALSWSDIAEWQRMTGANLEPWELKAIHRMERYRIDPDYDPIPPKPPEQVSLIKQLQLIQVSTKKDP